MTSNAAQWVKESEQEPWVFVNGRMQCPMPSSKIFKVYYLKPQSCQHTSQGSASSHFWSSAGSAKSFAMFDATFRYVYLSTMSLVPQACHHMLSLNVNVPCNRCYHILAVKAGGLYRGCPRTKPSSSKLSSSKLSSSKLSSSRATGHERSSNFAGCPQWG